MTESTLWPHLEYRVCREFAGLRDDTLRALRCDGFLPDAFHAEAPGPRITGQVWIGRGPRHQEKWQFTLSLGSQVRRAEEIDWSALLPPDDVTGWLSIDTGRKTMAINPQAAYPDRNLPTP